MTMSADNERRGWRQFAIGMTLYAVLIISFNVLSGPLQLDRRLLIVLATAPILVALWAMLGLIKVARSQDELQQKIISEALQWALGLTALFTFTYGFLEAYADFPRVSMFVVWSIICLTFVLGRAVSARRYR